MGGSGTINKITELPQYFGGGRDPVTKEVVESKLPSEIAPYVKDILGESQRLYEEAKEEKYVEEPETVAGVTEKELAAREGLVGLMGTRDPYLEEGLELYRGGIEKPTVEGIQEYMSPYQQLVTDIEKEKASEAYEAGRAGFEARGVGAGGMSGMGTRMGVEAGMRAGRHGENLAAIQARGSQKAYEDAQRVFQMQKQRERQAAGDIVGTGQDIYSAGLTDYGLQAQVGEEERADTQQQLDDLYRRWTQKQDFPETELAKYSGFVYGNPFLRQPDTTTTRTGPKGPSWGQQMFGAGLQALGSYAGGMGRGMGASAGKALFSKHGGGLHDLLETKYRKNSGGLSEDYWDVQDPSRPAPLSGVDKEKMFSEYLKDASKYGAGLEAPEEMRGRQAWGQKERKNILAGLEPGFLGSLLEGLGAVGQSAGIYAVPDWEVRGGWATDKAPGRATTALTKKLDAIQQRKEKLQMAQVKQALEGVGKEEKAMEYEATFPGKLQADRAKKVAANLAARVQRSIEALNRAKATGKSPRRTTVYDHAKSMSLQKYARYIFGEALKGKDKVQLGGREMTPAKAEAYFEEWTKSANNDPEAWALGISDYAAKNYNKYTGDDLEGTFVILFERWLKKHKDFRTKGE